MDARKTDATETMAGTAPTVSRVGLTLVHHPDRTRLGERVEVPAGASQLLGRGRDGLVAGHLDDRTVSKQHATLTLHETPATGVWIEDHESRNGTRVNGVEVSRAQLSVGDVLALGRIMFVVDADARPDPPMRSGAFSVFSASTCAVLRVGAQLADHIPRWIWGPPGAGKTMLARAWSPATPVILDARRLPHHDWSTADSVIVEHVDDAELGALETLCTAFETRCPRSLIFTSVRAPRHSAHAGPALAKALAWSFHLPPLVERPADVAAIAWSCADADPKRRPLSPQLLLALQSAAWPSNASGIEAVLERARLESMGETLDVFGGLGEALRPRVGGPETPHLRVAHTYAWFEGDRQARADLSRNPLLRRILDLLVQQHKQDGAPLGVDALFAQAWPSEHASAASRTNRVYVALTKLRKAGLKGVLERSERGYRLHPQVSVEVVRER